MSLNAHLMKIMTFTMLVVSQGYGMEIEESSFSSTRPSALLFYLKEVPSEYTLILNFRADIVLETLKEAAKGEAPSKHTEISVQGPKGLTVVYTPVKNAKTKIESITLGLEPFDFKELPQILIRAAPPHRLTILSQGGRWLLPDLNNQRTIIEVDKGSQIIGKELNTNNFTLKMNGKSHATFHEIKALRLQEGTIEESSSFTIFGKYCGDIMRPLPEEGSEFNILNKNASEMEVLERIEWHPNDILTPKETSLAPKLEDSPPKPGTSSPTMRPRAGTAGNPTTPSAKKTVKIGFTPEDNISMSPPTRKLVVNPPKPGSSSPVMGPRAGTPAKSTTKPIAIPTAPGKGFNTGASSPKEKLGTSPEAPYSPESPRKVSPKDIEKQKLRPLPGAPLSPSKSDVGLPSSSSEKAESPLIKPRSATAGNKGENRPLSPFALQGSKSEGQPHLGVTSVKIEEQKGNDTSSKKEQVILFRGRPQKYKGEKENFEEALAAQAKKMKEQGGKTSPPKSNLLKH